jgi:hypothetical protein
MRIHPGATIGNGALTGQSTRHRSIKRVQIFKADGTGAHGGKADRSGACLWIEGGTADMEQSGI